MNGLLTQKPGREPVAGETKLFLVEQRQSANGTAWTKVKNATADQGGVPYRVISVKPTGRTDQYGNISMNIEIEPSDGAPQAQLPAQRAFAPSSGDDRSQRIERQHSQHMALLHIAAKGSGFPDTEALRALIDWYHRDVGRMPAPPTAKAQPEPEMDEEMMPQGDADEEEAF